MNFVLAGLILAACALLAWRRARISPVQRGTNRWGRVAISSLSFAIGMTILTIPPLIQGVGSVAVLLPVAIVACILFGLVAFFLISVIEFILWRAWASRSRGWLLAAPAIFAAAFMPLPVAVAFAAGPGLSVLFGWELLQFLCISTGAGFIWWSHLPPLQAEVGPVFE